MPFHVLKGTFHLTGYAPDGDAIRFAADDPDLWDLLAGPPPAINVRGHVQLRLEGIDTLETHSQHAHQPLPLATTALDYLTTALGITQVQRNAAGTMVTTANDDVTGYILSRAVDKHHRPIAFAFSEPPPEADGAEYSCTRTAYNTASIVPCSVLAWRIQRTIKAFFLICARRLRPLHMKRATLAVACGRRT